MSFYDYQCTQCEHVQEEMHSILKEPEIKCNECGSICKRLMPTSANYILKGDDWADKRGKNEYKKTNDKV